MFESLEQRRYFVLPISGSVIDLDDTPDVAFVTAGNDVIEVILSGGNIQVRNSAGTVLDQRSANGITGISINGQGGNDFIRMGRADGTLMPTVPVTIRGGAGNDTIVGGNSADQLFGDAGNDRLDGRAGGDVMNGGSEFDTADYSSRQRSINVSLDNAANDGTNGGTNSSPAQYNDNGGDNNIDMEAVIGSSNADYMTGNSAANWFDGGGGNDTIFGGAGIDSITGGVNTDLAYGENDADFFFFQDSTGDLFLGGPGTTTAQYDAALDLPAPVVAGSPASASAIPMAGPAAPAISPLAGPLPNLLFSEESGPLLNDDTFSGNGTVATFIDGFEAEVNDVTTQLVEIDDEIFEEMIVVVGKIQRNVESDYDFLVARFRANGDLDTSFGTDETGFVLVDFGNGDNFFPNDSANSVVVDSSNKIVVVGGSEYFATDSNSVDLTASEYAAARLNPDGSLDTDFGDGGKFWGTPDDELTYDEATRVAIQWVDIGDNFFQEQYVITGNNEPGHYFSIFSEDTDSSDWLTMRLTNDGNVSTSFGNDGVVVTQFFHEDSPTDEYAAGLAVDPESGNIWIAGTQNVDFLPRFAVVGYDADGNPIDGAVNFHNYDDLAAPMAHDAILSGSQLIVVGSAWIGESAGAGAIAVFSTDTETPAALIVSDLVPDPLFNQTVAFRGVEVDAEGNGVAVGNFGEDFYVYRFELSELSQIDEAFIDFGAELDKETSFDIGTSVAIDSEGNIIVAGIADDPYAAIARLTSESTEPPFVDVELDDPAVQSFGFFISGVVTDPVPFYLVNRVTALKPDGSLELVGTDFDDVICVSSKNGILTVDINGELFQYNASLVTKVVIDGLGGNDVIKADDKLTIPVEFKGGSGHDLMVGAKGPDTFWGGTGNDLIMGLDGKDWMDGEGGNDLLLGGTGNDKLFGGDGRDVLIGGLGADLLRGGNDEDIVIGGFTLYDLVGEFLLKIRDEWGYSGRSWSQRFNNLSSPLSRGYNGLLFLRSNLTVYNDLSVDDLGGGGGNDWFFADTKGSHKDVIQDKTSGDQVSSH